MRRMKYFGLIKNKNPVTNLLKVANKAQSFEKNCQLSRVNRIILVTEQKGKAEIYTNSESRKFRELKKN